LVKKRRHCRYPKKSAQDPKNFSSSAPPPRVDVAPKCDGTAQFTMSRDAGILVALLKRSPLFGGAVKSFDQNSASQVRAS